jgi:multiple sugar transport system permease protein
MTNGSRGKPRAPYLFVAPAVLLFVAFLAIPIAYAIYLSTRGLRVSGKGIFGTREEVFVGLDNYANTLTDAEFWAGFGRLALYGLIAVPFTLGLALLFALLLDHAGSRAKRISRTAIFIPYAVPGVTASLLWGFMYLPSTSPFSYLSRELGLGTVPFLGGGGIYPSLANIAVWGGVGFNMIIIYTSLRGISAALYDSARIDGASEWQIAWRIKIPLVAPALVLTGLFALIGTLQVYSEPTTLRPMTTEISQTWVPLMHIYRNAFLRDDLPLASAASVLLAAGTLVISIVLLNITQKRAFGGME